MQQDTSMIDRIGDWYEEKGWMLITVPLVILYSIMVLSIIFQTVSAGPATWANSSRDYCRNITISQDITTAELTDFPVIIIFNSTNMNYSATQASGQDIVFYDSPCNDGGTNIPHEIEIWNEAGSSYVWVTPPNVSASADTIISVYYGNATAPDSQDSESVFGLFNAVWHLNSTDDATNNYTLSKLGAGEPADNSTGQVDGCQKFDGANDYMENQTQMIADWPITLEIWVKDFSSADNDHAIGLFDRSDSYPMYGIGVRSGSAALFARYSQAAGFQSCTSGNSDADGTWHHLVGVFHNDSQKDLYFDGSTSGGCILTTSVDYEAAVDDISIGANRDLTPSDWFVGNLDEARVYVGELSSEWINATYQSMANHNTFLSYGIEQAETGGDTTPPNVDWVTPTAANGTESANKTYIVWNISVSENIGSCSIEINGTNQTGTQIDDGSDSYCYYNETSLSGNVTRCAIAHASDEASNWNSTDFYVCRTTNEQQGADVTAPTITVVNPGNTSYADTPIDINVTLNENGDTCLWNLDSGTNSSMSGSGTNWYDQTNESLVDGYTYQINIYCNDTAGNMALNSSIWFTYQTLSRYESYENFISALVSTNAATPRLYYKNSTTVYALLSIDSIDNLTLWSGTPGGTFTYMSELDYASGGTVVGNNLIDLQNGTLMAFYAYNDGAKQGYYRFSYDDGYTWTDRYATISSTYNTHESRSPNSDTIHMVYLLDTPNDKTFYKNSTDNGTTWSTAIEVDDNNRQVGDPRIIALSDTIILMAVEENQAAGSDIVLHRSADGGRTWGADVTLYGSANILDHEPGSFVDFGSGTVAYIVSQGPVCCDNNTAKMRVSEDWGVTWGDEIIVKTIPEYNNQRGGIETSAINFSGEIFMMYNTWGFEPRYTIQVWDGILINGSANWSERYDGGSLDYSSSESKCGSYSLEVVQDNAAKSNEYYQGMLFEQPYNVSFYYHDDNDQTKYGTFYLDATDSLEIGVNTGQSTGFYSFNNGTWQTSAVSRVTDDWVFIEIAVANDNAEIYIDDTYVSSSALSGDLVEIRLNGEMGNLSTFYIDNLWIGNQDLSYPPCDMADTSAPSITIDNPDNTSYTSLPVDINVTASDVDNTVDTCLYNLDGGTNATLSNSSETNWYTQTNSSLVDGYTYQINVYCNDSLGNMGLNSSIWFTYNIPTIPGTITVTAYDESTNNIIDNYDARFTVSGTNTDFSINKSLIWSDKGTALNLDNPSYITDGDFDTYSYIRSQLSASPSEGGYYGTIYLENSDYICIKYDFDQVAGSVYGYYNISVKDSGSTWRQVGNFSGNSDTGVTTECFDLTSFTFDDNSEYMFNFTVGGTSTQHKFYFYELYNDYHEDDGIMIINITDLDIGSNTISIGDNNQDYYTRYYYESINASSNTSLDAYLAPRTETIVQSIFIVLDAFGSFIQGADLTFKKNIGGTYTTVAEDTTDSTGTASQYLIELQSYRLVVTHNSQTLTYDFTALAQTYTIIFNVSLDVDVNATFDDIYISIEPQYISFNASLTSYNQSFNYTIISYNDSLSMYGMRLLCNGTTQIFESNVTGDTNGGIINASRDIANCSNVTMEYYFIKDGTEYYYSVTWHVNKEYGFGLAAAINAALTNMDMSTLTFVALIILIMVMGGLAWIHVEGAAIAGIVVSGIFTWAGIFSLGIFIILSVSLFSVMLIKRRWL